MNTMTRAVKTFWQDQRGATAIEYGLIAALVSVAVIGGASVLGVNISSLFSNIANCLLNPMTGCMTP